MPEKPVITWARPTDVRVVWQFYVDDAIKVRMLSNGVVQFATGDKGWMDAE